MPSAARSLLITRRIDAVFAFFTNHDNDPTWRPVVKEIRAAGPPAVGARISQTLKVGGRTVPADIEITDYQPNEYYGFKVVAGPVRPEGTFQFAEVPGGTEVTLSLRAELGGLKKLFMSGAVQKSMEAEVAGLDRAKAVLESSG
jgi:hypothetical protein